MRVVKEAAFATTGADGVRLLTPMFCESDLYPDAGRQYPHNIDGVLLEDAELARSTANGMLAVASHKHCTYVKDC
jgi:hypothetical protein